MEDTKSSFSKCVSSTKSPFNSSSFERIESSDTIPKNNPGGAKMDDLCVAFAVCLAILSEVFLTEISPFPNG